MASWFPTLRMSFWQLWLPSSEAKDGSWLKSKLESPTSLKHKLSFFFLGMARSLCGWPWDQEWRHKSSVLSALCILSSQVFAWRTSGSYNESKLKVESSCQDRVGWNIHRAKRTPGNASRPSGRQLKVEVMVVPNDPPSWCQSPEG